MKVQEIIDLIDFISKKKVEEVKLETADIKLSIKKTGTKVIEQQVATALAPAVAAAPAPAPVAAAPAPAPAAAAPAAPAVEAAADDNYIAVKSPMIGTFYRSANPESPLFCEVGDKIAVGQTVCIVEAMKLFNEIESEVSGTIVKVLVENATPVEYDQPLFLVDPS
jgi:acetyl-CoA carboxylase biotin carboxyl carrier protein